MTEEPIVPWTSSRDAVQPLTAVRSTLIGSSIISLRTHGFEPRYLAALASPHRDAVLYTPAGVWLPVVSAEAHYAACDKLGLTDQEILAIGSEVAKATRKSVLAGILRLAREVGTTPWVVYAGCGKYWVRMFQGSAIAIFKLGPKEAASRSRAARWRPRRTGVADCEGCSPQSASPSQKKCICGTCPR